MSRTMLHTTVSYCTQCRTRVPASVVVENGAVWMRKLCPSGHTAMVKLAADESWYRDRMTRSFPLDVPGHARPVARGCPHDCGLCSNHGNRINLPVFSITNDCNLDCPICFTYNRPDRNYFKSVEEIRQIAAQLRTHRSDIPIVNLTGGEPTMHPAFFDIISALQDEGAGRITVNTNGITVAADESFAARIAGSGAQMVLSLNSFDPEKSIRLHGADITSHKRRALEYFERYGVPVTLLCVAVKSFNETDIAQIVREYLHKGFVKNIVIQNMTFTGANGSRFEPRAHITLDEVETALTEHAGLSRSDFFPLGSSHPLCYSSAYYFVADDRLLSLSQLIDRERLVAMSRGGYLLEPDAGFADDFRDGINRLWSEGADEGSIALLRSFFKRLYPAGETLSTAERARRAEASIKSIYIHAHMDEDTIDLGRLSRCGDIVPDESGAMIPACSYNLIYRETDERFWHR